MKKLFAIVVSLAASIGSFAQMYDGAINVDLNIIKPFSDTDFIDNTATGARIGYTKFFNEKFGGGLDVAYTTFDTYVPLTTYYYDGGAITTDLYNYHYYLTIGAKLVYRVKPEDKFTPYASLGMGAALTEYKIFYNVFQDQDSKTAFYMRPEAGVMYLFKEYGTLGVKASVTYDYAFNKSDYFGIDNFSGVGFQIGILLLN